MILADQSLVLRYIVPFSFRTDYDDLFQRMTAASEWTLCAQPAKKAVVFSHLYHSTYGDGSSNSLGSAWEFAHVNKLPQLTYTESSENFPVQWRVCHTQIHLFRTGIGLMWYEIEPLNWRGGLALDDLIQMQNRFKDCSYTKNFFSIKHRRRSKTETDSFAPFDAAVWLGELLNPLGDFHYMSGSCLKNGKKCPDKALIFNYVLLQQQEDISDQQLEKTAFWLANGYTQNYRPSPQALAECIHPFEDVSLYASRSGCGYYAAVNEGNHAFFTGNFNDSIRKDYFILYLLVLYQSFSLMHFSHICSMDFPSDPSLYNESAEIGAQLDALVLELNTFLMKGMHSSVSSVQHHNDFYNYLTTRLMIREDIESIKIGTDALVEIQHARQERAEAKLQEAANEAEKQRDRRQNIALAVLSLFSLFAVFQDIHALYWNIISLKPGEILREIGSGSWQLLGEVIAYAMVLFISICCVTALLSSFLPRHKKKEPCKQE